MDRNDYILDLVGPDPELQRILQRSREAGLPDIAVNPLWSRLLTLLVATRGAERVLEVGTLGGYGTLCLARGLPPGGRVITLELDPHHARVARENLQEAGVGDRVDVLEGVAFDLMDAMHARGERFDFFFIDADKESYPGYLDRVLALARPGALVAADNALWSDRVMDPAVTNEGTEALRVFNRRLVTDPRLRGVILPGADGLALARVQPA